MLLCSKNIRIAAGEIKVNATEQTNKQSFSQSTFTVNHFSVAGGKDPLGSDSAVANRMRGSLMNRPLMALWLAAPS